MLVSRRGRKGLVVARAEVFGNEAVKQSHPLTLREQMPEAIKTDHGFDWGAAKVTCGFDDEKTGWVTILLETPKYPANKSIQIYITKTGKVRIHDSNGEWQSPAKKAMRKQK